MNPIFWPLISVITTHVMIFQLDGLAKNCPCYPRKCHFWASLQPTKRQPVPFLTPKAILHAPRCVVLARPSSTHLEKLPQWKPSRLRRWEAQSQLALPRAHPPRPAPWPIRGCIRKLLIMATRCNQSRIFHHRARQVETRYRKFLARFFFHCWVFFS